MIDLKNIYYISKELVARNIEDEMVIVPLTSGIGDLSSEMYSLNETGADVWKRLDGNRDVHSIIEELTFLYDAPHDEIKKDVLSLLSDLAQKKLVQKK